MRQFFTALCLYTACIALAASPPRPLPETVPFQEQDPDWQLKEKRQGDQEGLSQIELYTKDHPPSSFKAFKAQAIIDHKLGDVFAVIADPGSCPLWVDGCLGSRNLELTSFNDRYSYALSSLPWPFKNRELAVRIITSTPRHKEEIHIQMFTDDRNILDANPDYVQIEQSAAYYILRALSDTQTHITWMQHTEPAGALPAWLVNTMITDLPLNSLAGLNQAAGMKRYTDAQIHYSQSGAITGLVLNNGDSINAPDTQHLNLADTEAGAIKTKKTHYE